MKGKLPALALSSLLLIGCMDGKALLQKFIPKDEDNQARHFIELVKTSDYDEAQKMLAPNLQGDRANEGLKQLHGLFDHGPILEIETIGCNTSNYHSLSENTAKINLSYQIHFKDSWLIGDVLLGKQSDGVYVLGSHFHPISDSLETLNRFTLLGKSPGHYGVLAFVVLIPAFILYALIKCIFSPLRRKWLWIIFILLGLGEFRFDWTSGLYEIQPISILLFGIGTFKSTPYSPWIFELAFPAGALVFLLRRRKLVTSTANITS